MIGEAIILALTGGADGIDDPLFKQMGDRHVAKVNVLDGQSGKYDTDEVTAIVNLIAVGDEPTENIDPSELAGDKAKVLLSVDASAGLPLTAFGGEIITRTAQVAIQVVGVGGAFGEADQKFAGARPIVDSVAASLMNWIENGAAQNVPAALRHIASGTGQTPPQLLSLVAQDATPDADENLERTVILVEAVTVPNP